MSVRLNKMEIRKNGFFITKTKPFEAIGTFHPDIVKQTFDFAYKMSFGKAGEHRQQRSGGSRYRKNGEIFANTFQGKLSEFAVYNTLKDNFQLNEPDLSTYGLGRWDDFDFLIEGKKASIKSTKSFGNLLLLETKDWNNNAEYIPNLAKGEAVYDLFILVRIKPDCEYLLKKQSFLYSDLADKSILHKFISSAQWEFDIPGFITNKDLLFAINNKLIINKGEMLNGKTKMDASNYYIQAADMHSINNIKGAIR